MSGPSVLSVHGRVAGLPIMIPKYSYPFGDGSGGDVVLSSNLSIPSVLDGPIVELNYNSLVVNAGVTLTTSNRCKGLVIRVRKNLTISGSISMSGRGCNQSTSPGNQSMLRGLAPGVLHTPESVLDYLLQTDFYIPQYGGVGGMYAQGAAGNPGAAGSNRGCGGGGAGGYGGGPGYYGGYGNEGGDAGAGGGGAGAGGGSGFGGNTGVQGGTGGIGNNYGGAGGNGGPVSAGSVSGAGGGGGGAGNPGGSPGAGTPTAIAAEYGASGTGGVLAIFVGGDLIINVGGIVSADGTNGGRSGGQSGSAEGWCGGGGGGGSGGGSVVLCYGISYTNNGVVRANGGSGGVSLGGQYPGSSGGNGGAGSISVVKLPAWVPF